MMEVQKKTFSEDEYFNLLKIKSEDDLFRDASDNKLYVFITCNDKNKFVEDTKHMCIVTRFVIDEMKWLIINKCSGVKPYQDIFGLFNQHLVFYIKKLKLYLDKVYVSIYKSYESEVQEEFKTKLLPLFDEYRNIEINKNEDTIWDLADLIASGEPPLCSNPEDNKSKNANSELYHYILEGAVNIILKNIKEIEFFVSAIYRNRLFRDNKENAIIYTYIKKSFDEAKLDAYLSQKKREYKNHLEDRRMSMNVDFLIKRLNNLEQTLNNYTLCKIWTDSVNVEDETEELAYKLNRAQATPDEFERLFKYQGERQMLKDEIAKMDDLERKGDPLFAPWVDPYKLEKHLEYWIKGNIKTQEKWYIVWCLMKYTFGMIKEGVDKNDFADRMNLMFKDTEKKCVVESFRKQETKNNHNCHFSKWVVNKSDYPIAQSLYEKLKNKELYAKALMGC